MRAEDFIQRVITMWPETKFADADGDNIPVYVTRSRNSNGYAAITLHVGKQELHFDNDSHPDYEQAARTVAELLLDAADNSCTLPAVKS